MHPRQAGSLVDLMSFQGPVAELPSRVLKRMGALGHHLNQWSEALEALRGRLEKGRLPEAWKEHVRAGLPEVGEAFERLEVSIRVPEGDTASWVVESSREEAVPALKAGARALLHLPALRKTWAGWLRESVLEDLQLRLGRAWVVDPTALPAHAALPGLNIARWGDLDRMAKGGRGFRISNRSGDLWVVDAESSETEWRGVSGYLAGCKMGDAVIDEMSGTGGQIWRAKFEVIEGRWELRELEK